MFSCRLPRQTPVEEERGGGEGGCFRRRFYFRQSHHIYGCSFSFNNMSAESGHRSFRFFPFSVEKPVAEPGTLLPTPHHLVSNVVAHPNQSIFTTIRSLDFKFPPQVHKGQGPRFPFCHSIRFHRRLIDHRHASTLHCAIALCFLLLAARKRKGEPAQPPPDPPIPIMTHLKTCSL